MKCEHCGAPVPELRPQSLEPCLHTTEMDVALVRAFAAIRPDPAAARRMRAAARRAWVSEWLHHWGPTFANSSGALVLCVDPVLGGVVLLGGLAARWFQWRAR